MPGIALGNLQAEMKWLYPSELQIFMFPLAEWRQLASRSLSAEEGSCQCQSISCFLAIGNWYTVFFFFLI